MAGKLCWGFTGDRDLLPDLHDFVGDIESSFRELADAAEAMEIQAVPRKSAARTAAYSYTPQPTPEPPGNPEQRGRCSEAVTHCLKRPAPVPNRAGAAGQLVKPEW